MPAFDLVLGTKVSTGSVCVHRDVTSEAVQCFVLAFSSCFKMASDKARWSNYVHSHTKYGFKGVKTTPFSAGTQAVVPQHQVWTAPMSGKYVKGLSSIVTAIQTVD